MVVVAIVSVVAGDNWMGRGVYFPNEVDYPYDGLTREQIAKVTLTHRSCIIEHSQAECKPLFNEIVEMYKKENIGKDVKVRDGQNLVKP